MTVTHDMATKTRRAPVIGKPGRDVSMLRYDCRWNEDMTGPGCGSGQRITSNYEQERTFMTGGSYFLVNRCAGCNQKISGSAMQSCLVTKEASE